MMATLCTVGYGDITATGDWERLYSIFLMILGASVFAIIVSNMSGTAPLHEPSFRFSWMRDARGGDQL